jgi:ubiquitin-protein ligase
LLDRDSADVRFRLQQSPFTADEDKELLSEKQQDYVITGQIFPTSEIFRERSYLIEMKLTQTFPLDPPQIRFLTPMYHPNIDKDGKLLSLFSMKQ